MKTILGLDLGVGSIGWALIKEDEIGISDASIEKLGVRTISYPTFVKSSDGTAPKKTIDEYLKGVGLSSNAGRTKMHGMRIRLQRYKLRRRHLKSVLEKNGIISKSTLLCEDGPNTTYETYSYRARAVEGEISLEQLARVFMMINKKRGFKSNRKDAADSDDNSESAYKKSLNQRSELLREEGLTVGQWKYRTMIDNPHFSFKDMVFYRQDYMDEFDKIWEMQSKYHPELTDALRDEIRDIIIFHQRPLRSQKSNINACRFESYMHKVVIDPETGKEGVRPFGCKVAPKSSPLFQEFRIWQNINNVMLSDYVNHTVGPLSQEDKETLFNVLKWTDGLSKKQALKAINKRETEYDLNFDKLEGNRTFVKILGVFEQWINQDSNKPVQFKKLKYSDAQSLLESFLMKNGVPENLLDFNSTLTGKDLEKQPYFQLWHLLYSYETDDSRSGNDKLKEILSDKFNLPLEVADKLTKIKFEPDYAGLSAKAMRKLLPHLKKGMRYDEACAAAGYNHSDSLTTEENDARELKPFMEPVGRNTLNNPIVEKVLNQLVNVVNQIIMVYGKPDEVRIELARELKKNSDQRRRMSESIRDNENDNERIRKILISEFNIPRPSKTDIVKYKLYEELESNGYRTLYSNTYVDRGRLFTREFDIEHIIPKAKLFNDAYSNKTLETRNCNMQKGDKTAMDYVETLGVGEVNRYKALVETLFKNKKIGKAKRDFLLMKEAEVPSDFLNRDLSQSQYIAKQATSMLKEVIRDVYTTTGSITKRLRDDWGLVDVLKEINWEKYDRLGMTEYYKDKNGKTIGVIKEWSKRDDHRHHAVDALVIALTKPAYIQYLNNVAASLDSKSELYGIRKRYLHTVDGHLKFKSPMSNLRSEARKHLESLIISTKVTGKVATKSLNKVGNHTQTTITPRGQLHDQTYYGRRLKPETRTVKVDGKMTADLIATVTNPAYKSALLRRLEEFGGDPKKAFTGKNKIDKNPIWIDENKDRKVPLEVSVISYKVLYTTRKKVDPQLNVKSVLDDRIRQILEERLEQFKGDQKAAFSNLEENPIWLDEGKTIRIKKVTTSSTNSSSPVSLHDKVDHKGNVIVGSDGNPLPKDFVATNNNHHAALYIDEDGMLHDRVVSFFDAVERKNQGLSIVDKSYNAELGWKFLFSMKKDEYFVFPDPSIDFYPSDVDLKDPRNAEIISKNLFRVQNISNGDYTFRHHLESKLRNHKNLNGLVWKRIQALNGLKDIVKVRINHIGQIVEVGE